jgi:hypothetical protein
MHDKVEEKLGQIIQERPDLSRSVFRWELPADFNLTDTD